MSTEEVLQKVKELVLQEYDDRFKSVDELTPDTPLWYESDNFWTSLLFSAYVISLAIEVEDYFNIEILDEELEEIRTIQQLVDFIVKKQELGLKVPVRT